MSTAGSAQAELLRSDGSAAKPMITRAVSQFHDAPRSTKSVCRYRLYFVHGSVGSPPTVVRERMNSGFFVCRRLAAVQKRGKMPEFASARDITTHSAEPGYFSARPDSRSGDASGFVSIVGQTIDQITNDSYRDALGVSNLSQDQVSKLLIDLKRRIQGDFYTIEQNEQKIVLGNGACPLGDRALEHPLNVYDDQQCVWVHYGREPKG